MNPGVEITKTVYVSTLNEYIKDLYKELEKINDSLAKHKSFLNGMENRKAEISMEIERVRSRIEQLNSAKDLSELGMDGPLATHYSEALTENAEQTMEAKAEIQKLQQELRNTDDISERMVIQRKIEYQKRQYDMLLRKKIKLGKRQRTIVLAKSKIEKIKGKGMIKAGSKAAIAEAKADEIQAKIDASPNSDNILSTIIEKGREVRVNYYRRKAENARKVLEMMDNKTFIKGARAIAIAKNKASKLSERMKQQTQDKDMSGMFPPEVKGKEQTKTATV